MMTFGMHRLLDNHMELVEVREELNNAVARFQSGLYEDNDQFVLALTKISAKIYRLEEDYTSAEENVGVELLRLADGEEVREVL